MSFATFCGRNDLISIILLGEVTFFGLPDKNIRYDEKQTLQLGTQPFHVDKLQKSKGVTNERRI